MYSAIRHPAYLSTVLLAVIMLAGCGGSGKDAAMPMLDSPGQSAATGRAALSVRWPEPSRLIPFAANSIHVRLAQGSAILGERLLVRPASGGEATVTFERLPVGDGVATATAYPNADGTGVAQAQAQVGFTIVASQTTNLRLTLASTIDRMEIAPAQPSPLAVGQTLQLAATAKNAAGETVLAHFFWVRWKSLNPAVATVNPTGIVTAVAPGTTTIEVTEMESGKVGTVTIGVAAPVPGQLLMYDGFDYPADSRLENQNGGSGWARGWNEYGQGYTPSRITTDGLTYGNLLVSGRAVRTTSRMPIGHARVPAQQVGVSGTVLYASILLRPLDPLNVGWPDTYFGFGFSDMLLGKPGASSKYSIEKRWGPTAHTSVDAAQNTTVFLVARVTFRDGPDTIELWVNPVPGQPLPPPHATKSDADVSLPGDVGIGSSISVIFDEYRIGLTWESVSPTVP